MKLLVLILFGCVLGTAMAISRPHYDPAKVQQYFNEFIVKYNKHYDDRSNEKLRRFQIFKDNLKKIIELNSRNKAVFGITKFTDLSPGEFEEEYGSCTGEKDTTPGAGEESCTAVTDDQLQNVEPPEELDFRDRDCVSSVKNQGNCKSCWAFTVVGVLEGVYRIRYGELLEFSPMQLMSCLPSSGNCTVRGNWPKSALEDIMEIEGVMEAKDYPYEEENAACEYDATKAKVNVTSCSYFTLESEDYLRHALWQRGPIGITYNSEPLQNYVGGIISADICPASTSHASLLVGYGTEINEEEGTETDYWLIKNTWGADWGEEGYVRIARGGNACGILSSHVVSARVA